MRGREPSVPDPEQAKPEAKAQRNFTDPDSRIMPDGANKGSFLQGYNAQASVDATAQVIVAAEVTQESNDNRQLLPMLGQVKQNLGRQPDAASADAGYWSEANVTDESVVGIDLHIATGRDKHGEIETAGEPPPDQPTAKEAMRHKLRIEAGRSIYKMRKAIVERKRPEFPSGMSLASRPNMPSWVFQRKRDLSDRFAGGGQCRRSGG